MRRRYGDWNSNITTASFLMQLRTIPKLNASSRVEEMICRVKQMFALFNWWFWEFGLIAGCSSWKGQVSQSHGIRPSLDTLNSIGLSGSGGWQVGLTTGLPLFEIP